MLRGNFELVYLVVPLSIPACLHAKHFNIVGMGANFARNLSVYYKAVLFLELTLAAMITAFIESVVGAISYIALIVPNIVSLFIGDNLRSTLPDTALFGALFVLVCDLVARTIITPYELPVELIVDATGSLIFIALIFYRLRFGRSQASRASLAAIFKAFRTPADCSAQGSS